MTVSISRPVRPLAVLAAVALATAAAGCGRTSSTQSSGKTAVPVVRAKAGADAPADLGFPTFATKNTTRLAGSDPVADAAAAAQIVFPSTIPSARPQAVTLVDAADWQAALAASAFNASPLNAPVLFTHGSTIPSPSTRALNELQPTGSQAAGGAQAIRVGTTATPGALRTTDIRGTNPFVLAGRIDAFLSAAQGKPSTRVILVTADDPAFAAPAAGLAATTGDPILFTHKDSVPPATIAAIKAHGKPKIYVLGPSSIITPKVTQQLKGLGRVTRLGGQDPVANAIEFATYADGDFGWGATTPGHGLVMLPSGADPAAAAAIAPLSASGTYGPLLLLSSPAKLDAALAGYLKDLQPGYLQSAARGFYNHAWLVGDTTVISPGLQAQVDGLLETQAIKTKGATK